MLKAALVLVAVLWAGDLLAQEPARPQGTAAQDVFVPSFWDPAAIPERPPFDTSRPLRFITEDDHPPFGFLLADGTLVGFDVDLARALCNVLKATCTIQVRRFDTVVPAIKAGAADAAVASLAITDASLSEVDFTRPYYKTPARFLARASVKPVSLDPDSLRGRPVGVEGGTAHEAFLKAFFPDADIRSFATPAEAREALKTGRIDYLFADGIASAQWLGGPEAAGCCAFVGGPYLESRFFGRGAGIAVRRGDGTLRAALDYALARVAADGTYGELYLKYFPIGIY